MLKTRTKDLILHQSVGITYKQLHDSIISFCEIFENIHLGQVQPRFLATLKETFYVFSWSFTIKIWVRDAVTKNDFNMFHGKPFPFGEVAKHFPNGFYKNYFDLKDVFNRWGEKRNPLKKLEITSKAISTLLKVEKNIFCLKTFLKCCRPLLCLTLNEALTAIIKLRCWYSLHIF